MGNLLRQYKLHSLEPCLSDNQINFINHLKEEIKNLELFNSKYYKDSNFYFDKINNQILFCYDFVSKDFYTSVYFNYQVELIHKFTLDTDIKNLIKNLIEQYLKLEIRNFSPYHHRFSNVLEEYIKSKNEQHS